MARNKYVSVNQSIEKMRQILALRLENVSFSYNKNSKNVIYAIKGINLNVFSGKIYAFIGPSGCGKTTLVHCCVGAKTPLTGSIKVFGKYIDSKDSGVPGSVVGYMPQELALYPDFTIYETLNYFGQLYGLSSKLINSRIKELTEFLQLPSSSRLVSELSGGQQRRVSFAVALLHNPKILIVDEPTVGLDPILRRSIWQHLQKLAKKDNLSVIITTHYIEEASAADVVCFLRGGHLLTAESPKLLMRYYSVNRLEDVFLELCLLVRTNESDIDLSEAFEETVIDESFQIENTHNAQNSSTYEEIYCTINNSTTSLSENKNEIFSISKTVSATTDSPPSASSTTSLLNSAPLSSKVGRIYAMCRKNIVRLRHNIAILIFQFLIPAVSIILYCTCFGREPKSVSVAVVNSDIGPLSYCFLSLIDNSTIKQVNFKTFNESFNSLLSGETSAVFAIDGEFSKSYDRGSNLSESTSKPVVFSSVKVYIDWTNHIIAGHIQKAAFQTMIVFDKVCTNKIENRANLNSVIDFQKPIYGDKIQSLNEFMTPGNIIVFIFFSASASTALVFVVERKEGTLQRVIISGVKPDEFLFSHLLQQILILLGQILIMLTFTFYLFDIKCNGSIFLIYLIVLLQGLCGMAYGLFISSICDQEGHAFILLMGSLLPNFLMSGYIWPLETMPDAIMYTGKFLPNARAIESLRFIIYRGWSLTDHLDVFAGYAFTILWISIFLILALHCFKRAI